MFYFKYNCIIVAKGYFGVEIHYDFTSKDYPNNFSFRLLAIFVYITN